MTTVFDKFDEAIDIRRKMDGWRHTFQKVDRVVSGQSLILGIHETPEMIGMGGTPGWTDGETVSFNGRMLADDLRVGDINKVVLAWTGVNYHELAHCLYSPRLTSDICKRVIQRANEDHDQRWWHALNILEDQRAEMLFTSAFEPSVKYFEALSLKWLVTNQDKIETSHILVHGRKFLPVRIRMKARSAFVRQHGKKMADEFASIIDRYLMVVYNADTNLAFKLVRDFRELMIKLGKQVSGTSAGGDMPQIGAPREDSLTKGEPGIRDQRNARDQARTVIVRVKAEEEKAEKEGAGDAGDQKADSQDDSPTESSPSEGPTSPSKGQDDQASPGDPSEGSGTAESPTGADSDSEGEGGSAETDESTGSKPGTGVSHSGNDGGGTLQDLLNEMSEALEAVQQDSSLQKDIDATIDTIRSFQKQEAEPQGTRPEGTVVTVSTDTQSVVKRLGHALGKIKMDLEPSWERRQTSGRINMQRILTRKPHEIDIFDKWEEGREEEAGAEAVIVVDLSGSMHSIMGLASEALWATKRAFDDLDIRTTVLGYSSECYILMNGDEKANRVKCTVFPSYSATYPVPALNEAMHILVRSDKPNKLLISITDGAWGYGQEADDMVRMIRKNKGMTMLIGLRQAVERYGKHCHEEAHDIASITELPEVAAKMAAAIMRNVKNR